MPFARISLFCCLLAVLLAQGCASGDRVSNEQLSAELDASYERWSSAALASDLVAWKRASSRQSYKKTVNNLVSMKERLTPATLANLARFQPTLSDYEFVGTNRGDETAVAVYFGGRADLKPHFLILDFLRQDDEWKFHWSTQRDDLLDAETRWAKRDLSFLDEGVFGALETIPPVPPDCPLPDYISALKIESLGYETVVRMHGFDYGPIADNSFETIIFGGLLRGPNVVELSMRPIPSGGIKSFRVSVSILLEGEMRGMDERYVYEPEEVPESFQWTIDAP
jgi:hypothetical protein